jgi:hypothetical protein
MKVINNVLKEEDSLKIKNKLESSFFPWYVTIGINNNFDKNFQFTHNFYSDYSIQSEYFNLLLPIIEILRPISILRIKANLLTKENKIIEHGMHCDNDFKHNKTAIYYVNDNNGYTKFENGKKIISEKNKLVTFKTNIKHTGTTCTDNLFRIIINFNYF